MLHRLPPLKRSSRRLLQDSPTCAQPPFRADVLAAVPTQASLRFVTEPVALDAVPPLGFLAPSTVFDPCTPPGILQPDGGFEVHVVAERQLPGSSFIDLRERIPMLDDRWDPRPFPHVLSAPFEDFPSPTADPPHDGFVALLPFTPSPLHADTSEEAPSRQGLVTPTPPTASTPSRRWSGRLV